MSEATSTQYLKGRLRGGGAHSDDKLGSSRTSTCGAATSYPPLSVSVSPHGQAVHSGSLALDGAVIDSSQMLRSAQSSMVISAASLILHAHSTDVHTEGALTGFGNQGVLVDASQIRLGGESVFGGVVASGHAISGADVEVLRLVDRLHNSVSVLTGSLRWCAESDSQISAARVQLNSESLNIHSQDSMRLYSARGNVLVDRLQLGGSQLCGSMQWGSLNLLSHSMMAHANKRADLKALRVLLQAEQTLELSASSSVLSGANGVEFQQAGLMGAMTIDSAAVASADVFKGLTTIHEADVIAASPQITLLARTGIDLEADAAVR